MTASARAEAEHERTYAFACSARTVSCLQDQATNAERTEIWQEVLQECLRDVETIVFPNVVRQTSVLLVLVMIRDPEFRRPVKVGEIKWLDTESEYVLIWLGDYHTFNALIHDVLTYTSYYNLPRKSSEVSSRVALPCIACPMSMRADDASFANLG